MLKQEMNWEKAKDYLQRCEKVYTEIGSNGYWVLNIVVRPLRDRFNEGERSEDLYNAIMNIQ